jgi:hypothetical protein
MLKALTRAESAATAFAVALAAAYGLLPFAVHRLVTDDPYFLQLARIAGLGAACVVVGSRLGVLDGLGRLQKRAVESRVFVAVVWGAFLGFVIVACVTADRIPFVAALEGTDPETLALLRERFLKAREGWQSIFVYINAVLAGALVPYSLMLMLLRRHRWRWVFFGVFLVYCVSFVEKVFFFKAFIPFAFLVFQGKIASIKRPGVILAGALGVLVLLTVISGASERNESGTSEDFFSTAFSAQGAGAFLAWRAIAVPVVTAADTLRVFEDEYGGRPLLGASSSLLAGVLGRERVSVERDVFAAQFGQTETETGSANAVYLTEAYLNFGYAGVAIFSLVIGLILRLFARSQDEALRSLWMLFCFSVFVGPLTATLISNGFLFVLILSSAARFEEGTFAEAEPHEAPDPEPARR